MKRLKVKKDVEIYHPTILVAEKGSILRAKNGVTFGVIGNPYIMNKGSHPKKFAEYFEEIKEKRKNV